MYRAGSRKPSVSLASPVWQPPSAAHARSSSGPAAAKIAPHTPPPRARRPLAALTIASTDNVVISPSHGRIRAAIVLFVRRFPPGLAPALAEGRDRRQ